MSSRFAEVEDYLLYFYILHKDVANTPESSNLSRQRGKP